MNAITLLDAQHDEVSALFEKFEGASTAQQKQNLYEKIADSLAAHATIEEKIFYPAVKAARTEDILLESVEEHLGIKRIIADLLGMSPADTNYDAKMKVLKEEVEHHVGEERSKLFPEARKLLIADALEALGKQMEAMFVELMARAPRLSVPKETAKAAAV